MWASSRALSSLSALSLRCLRLSAARLVGAAAAVEAAGVDAALRGAEGTGDVDAGVEGSGGTGDVGAGAEWCGGAGGSVLADLGGLGEDVELGELPIRRLSVSQGLCDSSTPRWGTAVDVPTEIVGEGGSARWR